jgi:hypothetical protein
VVQAKKYTDVKTNGKNEAVRVFSQKQNPKAAEEKKSFSTESKIFEFVIPFRK